MVEDGQAFVYRQYLSGCDAKEYLGAEFRASRRRYGVWQVEGGITRPWDFRKGRSTAVIPDGTTPGGRRTSSSNAPAATASASEYYANIDTSLSGDQFRAQLTELIGDHHSIGYGKLWDAFEVIGGSAGGQPG